jgi:hypothetical protein
LVFLESPLERLRALGLVNGEEALPASALEACEQGRLVGGLSISLRATADELVGPLTHAMGGAARDLKVLDVLGPSPLRLELSWRGSLKTWVVDDVEHLITRLDDFFGDEDDVKPLVILGEWEDQLQVWALRWDLLEVLLSTQLLASARNINALREFFDGD